MGVLHGSEIDFNVDVVEEKGAGYAVMCNDCKFAGVFEPPVFPVSPLSLKSTLLLRMCEACEELVEGPNAWNDRFSIAGHGKDESRLHFVVCKAPVAGWAVEGAGLVPKKPEMTNECGYSPWNALGVPKKATVIASLCDVVRGHTESKGDAPDMG